jgi:hypothetical protein
VEKIESIIDYGKIGKSYYKIKIKEMIVIMKKEKKKGRKIIIICKSRRRKVMEDMEMM